MQSFSLVLKEEGSRCIRKMGKAGHFRCVQTGRFVGKVHGWSGGGACPEEVRLELDLGVKAGVDQREASGWTAGDVLGDEGWPGLPSGKMRGSRKTERLRL